MSVNNDGNIFKGLLWGFGLSIPIWTLIIFGVMKLL